MTIKDRLLARVEVDREGCWLWLGYVGIRNGYGSFGAGKLAHRVAYEAFVGAIPPGLQIDHLCKVRRCVNPDHLEAVTQRENLLRGDTVTARNAARTECPRGHPYTPENTYRSNGKRRCRICTLASNRRSTLRSRNAQVLAG